MRRCFPTSVIAANQLRIPRGWILRVCKPPAAIQAEKPALSPLHLRLATALEALAEPDLKTTFVRPRTPPGCLAADDSVPVPGCRAVREWLWTLIGGGSRCLLLLCMVVLAPSVTLAAKLNNKLEIQLVSDVSTAWTMVALDNTYNAAVPVCTYTLKSFSGANPVYDHPPAVTRVRNVTSSSFELRVQGWEDGPASTADVHCLVAEEGAHTLPDGRLFEAHKVLSDHTSGQYSSDGAWDQNILENVTASIVHNYSSPVVLGQVVSDNDSRASVFHTTNCSDRKKPPFHAGPDDGICVGKHIGMIPGNRASEWLGYIVAEAGSGTASDLAYTIARGGDSIAGNSSSNKGYSYTVGGDFDLAVASQIAEDGGNGSWAVLYGNDPLPLNKIWLAVDEEIAAGDATRNHTSEQVDYWAVQSAALTLLTAVINDNGGSASVADFALAANGPDALSGVSGIQSVTRMLVAPGGYSLSGTGPQGYTLSWSCAGASSFSGGVVSVALSDAAVCTLTADDLAPAQLTLSSSVVNDDGGNATVADFMLSFDNGFGNTSSGAQGDAPVTSVSIPAGAYTLSSTGAAGYAELSIACNGSDINAADGLLVQPGEQIVCDFVQDDLGVDLVVTKQASNVSPNLGDQVVFTLVVANQGPDNATNLNISDVLPSGLAYVTASIAGGDTRDDTQPASAGLSWNIDQLAVGSSASLTYATTIETP